ncbi:uncharacterized protein LOC120367417 isoform X5 [Saimiri boliviensis]|uniref:uncharacterized protein LOC120367417 isoform X5 n=1 Tax=Saimiri boliviensis TaxID=27679 RepID=UPI003D7859CB
MEPFSLRNWKEELQTVREVPNKNRPEQLLQERAMFKGPETPASGIPLSVESPGLMGPPIPHLHTLAVFFISGEIWQPPLRCLGL